MNQLFEEFIAEFFQRELREVWQVRGNSLGDGYRAVYQRFVIGTHVGVQC